MHSDRRSTRREHKTPSKRGEKLLESTWDETTRKPRSSFGSVVPAPRSNRYLPPIENASKEKQIIEKKGHEAWVRWLFRIAHANSLMMSGTAVDNRLCEVYRQCFEASGAQDMSIISDFIAQNPRTAFRCDWVAELLRVPPSVRYYSNSNIRRILLALSSGFERAASKRNLRRSYLAARLEAARHAQKTLSTELSRFFSNLNFRYAAEPWLVNELQKKASEIVSSYSLTANVKDELLKLLEKRQAYKASLLVTALCFRIRQRDLQSQAATS